MANPDDATALGDYNFAEVEHRWQQRWIAEGTFDVEDSGPGEPMYIASMMPYPSGSAHMGHVRNYSIADVLVRYHRATGKRVLSPFGYDAFGLPAENAAIKHGIHPREFTDSRVEQMRRSIENIGTAYDWRRELRTDSPEYIEWNQWLFKQLVEADLAYQAEAPVNWCPGCKTVLANEQVMSDGTCERSGDEVTQRDMKQWFIRTTAYADELLDDLDGLDGWSDSIKAAQRTWIGRSRGLELEFGLTSEDGRSLGDSIRIYTTRPDTIHGVTFVAVAPEHPMLGALCVGDARADALAYAGAATAQAERDRIIGTDALPEGAFTGSYVRNPLTGDVVPVYVAAYVLRYGTGAVMGAPGEDARDFALAREHGIAVPWTTERPEGWNPDVPFTRAGVKINSGSLDGLDQDAAIAAVIAQAVDLGVGEPQTQYRLRDWSVSRQRYWGTPIPVVYCDDCGPQLVPDEELPVLLPDDVEFNPTGTSPLAGHDAFSSTTCPCCGGTATRETDTLDTFVDSSWYFLRYAAAARGRQAFDLEALEEWMPMDWYIGGAEHATMHLLYARFYTKALADLGIIPGHIREPFTQLFNHGMIKLDGMKMSKSKGNIVVPEEYIERVGADALRIFNLFQAPPGDAFEWEDANMEGPVRFMSRYWSTARAVQALDGDAAAELSEADVTLRAHAHRLVAAVESDILAMRLHKGIALQMAFLTEFRRYLADSDTPHAGVAREALFMFTSVLAPFAPHMTSEVAERVLGIDINVTAWPELDQALLVQETATVAVTVDGKMCGRIEVPLGIDEDDAVAQAMGLEGVVRRVADRQVERVVVKVPQVVNFVTTPVTQLGDAGEIIRRPLHVSSKPTISQAIVPGATTPPSPGIGR